MKTFLSVLTLTALATAQTPAVSASLHTAADLGVYANHVVDGARAGVNVSAGLGLSAVDGRNANSDSKVGIGRGPIAMFSWNAHAEAGSSAGTRGSSLIGLAAGPQKYSFGLKASTAVKGKLLVEFHGRATNAGAGASIAYAGMKLAFRADGTTQKKEIPGITIGPLGNRFGIEISGQADARNSRSVAAYAAGFTVTFVSDSPGGCTVSPHHGSCRTGGHLQASILMSTLSGAALNMGLQGALPGAIGVTFVSVTGQTFNILNGTCIFFRHAIVADTFKTDRAGNARTTLKFPVIHGGQFFVHQATALLAPGSFKIATSNSLVVKCR